VTTADPIRTNTRVPRPGILEVVVGLVVFGLVSYGSPSLLKAAGLDTGQPVAFGLALGALSGVAGIVAFIIAARIRVRALRPFGIRRTSWRWIVIGVAGGIVVWIVARILVVGYTLIFGIPENVQETYNTAAQGGVAALILSTLFLAVLTPLGEELLFRGIVANVLLRWGWVCGVLGSAVIFMVFHGLTGFNITYLAAFVEGVVAADLYRRSGSIWPGVVVHITNNTIANLLAAGAS
jgi:membrane protease YdiL (CAAX protease family)